MSILVKFRLPWRFHFIIAVLAFTAYAPILKVGFLWDDHVMIEANPWLRHWSFAALGHDFSTDVFDGHGDPYYRPAQTILNRINFSIGGLKPFGYHLTNLLIHTVGALALAELLAALGFSLLVALIASCFFAVHPIGVEQLLIIAGRAELAGFLCVCVSLWCLLAGGLSGTISATFAFAIGLFFKESVIVTPLLGALAFYRRDFPFSRYRSLIALLVPIPLYVLLRDHAVGTTVPWPGLWMTVRFLTQSFPNILLHYAELTLVPWNLHSHRMVAHLSHAWPLYLAILVTGTALSIRKGWTLILFCFGWFSLSLLPKFPIMMTGGFMLDHWAYPAAPGLFVPLSILLVRSWERPTHRLQRALALFLFPLLIFWALLTRLNIELRGTDEKMYRWALHFTDSHPLKANLATLLIETNRSSEAVPLLEEVRMLYPNDPRTLYALAKAYDQIGERKTAISILRELIRKHPNDTLAVRTYTRLIAAPASKKPSSHSQ